MNSRQNAPAADHVLSALALLESFENESSRTSSDITAMLTTTDVRTLLAGMLDVASLAATIAGNASQTSRREVFTHLREMALDMVSDGQLSSGTDGTYIGEVRLDG